MKDKILTATLLSLQLAYTADQEDFNDKEYIFDGTALERDKGS